MSTDPVFGDAGATQTTVSEPNGSKANVRWSLLALITLLLALAVWLLLWGLLDTFDPYGPSVTEDATITRSERVRRTCSNSNNNSVRRTCYRFVVEGRSASGDEWDFESKGGVESLSRGDDVLVVRSSVTGRVIGMSSEDYDFDAQTSLQDRALALLPLLAGGVLTIFIVSETKRFGKWRPVVLIVGISSGIVGVGALHVDPVDVDSSEAAGLERTDPTQNSPTAVPTTAMPTTAVPTTAVPTSSAEDTTSTVAITTTEVDAIDEPTTTIQQSLTAGSAADLMAAFLSASFDRPTTTQTVSHADDAGTFNAALIYPEGWTPQRSDDDPYRLDILQPESEFAEYQTRPDRVRLTAWRRRTDEFAEQVDGFLVNSGDDPEVYDQGRTAEGRQMFVAQRQASDRVVHTRVIIDADTHIAAFDLYHQPEDTELVEILLAVAASARFT